VLGKDEESSLHLRQRKELLLYEVKVTLPQNICALSAWPLGSLQHRGKVIHWWIKEIH